MTFLVYFMSASSVILCLHKHNWIWNFNDVFSKTFDVRNNNYVRYLDYPMTLFLYGSVGALTGKLVEFAAFIAYPAFITTTLGLTVLAVNSVKHYLSEPLRPIPASTSPEPEPKSPSADSAISNPTDDELLTIPQKVSLDTPFNHNDLDLDDVLVGLLKEARAIDLAEQDI